MRHYFLDLLPHLFQLLAITGRPLSSQNLLVLTSANMSDLDYDTPGWFWQEFSETPRHIVAHHTAVTRSTVAPSRQWETSSCYQQAILVHMYVSIFTEAGILK